MKKILLAVALSSLSIAASAEGWKFAPGLSEGFKYEPSIALTAGSVKPRDADSGNAYGLEVNFNCGLIQTPDNRMRTHFSVSRTNEDQYGATIVELSPRYTVPLADGLSIGVGPSLGTVRLNPAAAAAPSATMFAYGVMAGLNYRKGALYAGLDVGARRTKEKNGLDFDGRAVTLKVGYNF